MTRLPEIAFLIGRSTQSRPLLAERFGTTGPTVLILCAIHGNEASTAIFGDQLRSRLLSGWADRHGVRILLVQAANPDGLAAGTRENANGVDLNRDFPATNADGPTPPTQPESRCLRRLVDATAPDAILAIHCCEPLFDWDGPARDLARVMSDAMPDDIRFPVERLGAHPGSLGSWAGRDLGIPTVTVEFDCHGPTDIRRQLDTVEESVDAAFRHVADTASSTDAPADVEMPRIDDAAFRSETAGTSAGGLPIRLDVLGPDTRPDLLILGGLADNDPRSLAVAEHLRRALFCRSDAPSTVAALTAANPDGIPTAAPTNADGEPVPDDFASGGDATPEARTVVELIDDLSPRLVVSVEADDEGDTIDASPNSPVSRRLDTLGPPVLRLGIHRRYALGRNADDVPDPDRWVEAVLAHEA